MREHLMAFEDLIRQLRVAGAKLQSDVDMVISLNHVKQRLLVEEMKQQERYLNFFLKRYPRRFLEKKQGSSGRSSANRATGVARKAT